MCCLILLLLSAHRYYCLYIHWNLLVYCKDICCKCWWLWKLLVLYKVQNTMQPHLLLVFLFFLDTAILIKSYFIFPHLNVFDWSLLPLLLHYLLIFVSTYAGRLPILGSPQSVRFRYWKIYGETFSALKAPVGDSVFCVACTNLDMMAQCLMLVLIGLIYALLCKHWSRRNLANWLV